MHRNAHQDEIQPVRQRIQPCVIYRRDGFRAPAGDLVLAVVAVGDVQVDVVVAADNMGVRRAADEGVKVLAYECDVTIDGLEISKEVEVRL